MSGRARAPEVATPRAMSAVAGTFLIAGSLPACYLVATSGGHLAPGLRVMAVLAVCAMVTGTAVLVGWRWLPRWSYHVMDLAATLVVSVSVWVCPWPDVALALTSLYVYVAIDTVFFFLWRAAAAHLAVMLVSVVVVLHARPDVTAASVVAVVVALLAITGVVYPLVRRASSASVDSLTGLLNRRGVDDALQAALVVAERGDRPLSAALVDVDHFKEVNDHQGHAAGDELLRALARECSAALPREAVLARRGGDEFLVLLPGWSGERAREALERMAAAFGVVGLSCGIAEHLPGHSGADLLRRADVALYEAKASGRGRTVLAAGSDGIVRDLAAAIDAGTIDVAFQPIVALDDGRTVGVEALARWNHPERGPVSPAVFIPAAEAADLIVGLGELVLRTACRAAAAVAGTAGWPPELVLTVNVSGRQLMDPGFADRVGDVLADTGWAAAQLVVEVTESLLEASSDRALTTLEALRARGVAVALDDFGTGYSSLARLDVVPADYLKLDSTFIATITTSSRRAGVLRALVELAASLGLRVIAEGVETPEQAMLLVELGCPLAQGYFFGRPELAGGPAPVRVLHAAHR